MLPLTWRGSCQEAFPVDKTTREMEINKQIKITLSFNPVLLAFNCSQFALLLPAFPALEENQGEDH